MTSIPYILLGSFLLLAIVEGHSKSLERITYGHEAKEGQFPYIVSLASLLKDGSYVKCGGSIIANDWILTAAHCTTDALSVTIHYGSTNREQAKVSVSVAASNIIQHPIYQENPFMNDIALIHSDWVDFNDRIQSIALPRPNQRGQTFAGQWARAAGWGIVKDHLKCTPVQLHWVDLQIIENSICGDIYPIIDESKLCVATPNRKSVCNGDSGGPLVLLNETILVGVSSFVHTNGCESGIPAGFTRVSEYLDWIRDISGVSSDYVI